MNQQPQEGDHFLSLLGMGKPQKVFSSVVVHYESWLLHSRKIFFRGAAKNTFYLKKIRMTHILNAAEGSGPGYVDTDPDFYRVFGIKYKGLKLKTWKFLFASENSVKMQMTNKKLWEDEWSNKY